MVKNIILDYRVSDDTIKSLKALNKNVIKTTRIHGVYDAICGHADIQAHYIGKNTIICAPEAYNHYLKTDLKVIKGSKKLKECYPEDIFYNAAAFGNFLICKAEYTSPEILEIYNNRTLINVKQGYSKCSICIISDNAIITADNLIYKAAAKHGIDVLKIQEGFIELPGMQYGFLGGATGLIDKYTLAVNGNLKTHPDYNNIYAFSKNYNVDIIALNNGIPVDVGSLIACYDF